jgi:hypothetical protein
MDEAGPNRPDRRDDDTGSDGGTGRRASEVDAGDDFADEHSSPTFADQAEGGPERSPEPESPEGHAGMD